ncbi:hypothetical protein SAMN05216470_1424 [Streptococcus equinus]|uniref:Uncharacterized protein n=1 Tax=Streptococcus equinus TaxID=1335 RepID=A0A239RDQ4_STREI|nr:hypothetical protein [Streptococcus equinus]SNU08731.1 hypothetical protein SAMN05216470_1424 [Streptococcus equinus]
MESIKFNGHFVAVPAETVLEYLKYRKLNKEPYYFGMEETLDMYLQNIMNWANDIKKLDTTFPELEPELEKLALELI